MLDNYLPAITHLGKYAKHFIRDLAVAINQDETAILEIILVNGQLERYFRV